MIIQELNMICTGIILKTEDYVGGDLTAGQVQYVEP